MRKEFLLLASIFNTMFDNLNVFINRAYTVQCFCPVVRARCDRATAVQPVRAQMLSMRRTWVSTPGARR